MRQKNGYIMRSLLAATVYPVTMVTGVALSYLLLYQWQWPLYSILLPLATAFILVGVMERVQPYRPQWNQSHGDVLTDVVYITVNLALREVVNLLGRLGLVALLAALLAGANFSLDWWPQTWPIVLQLILAILIFDCFEYWFHRLSHRYRFLWRFHAIHHSVKRLYFFNAARFHIVDWVMLSVIEFTVLFLLGASPELIALCIVFIQIHGLFQHSNIDLKLGVLNYLVSGPELHRWHHSKIIQESDTNFGNNVIVWDLLFGTYFWPKQRQVGELGLLNPNYPQTYWQQLIAAFKKIPLDKQREQEPPS